MRKIGRNLWVGFAEYDRWVGYFIKREPAWTTYYICPLPCLLIQWMRYKEKPKTVTPCGWCGGLSSDELEVCPHCTNKKNNKKPA